MQPGLVYIYFVDTVRTTILRDSEKRVKVQRRAKWQERATEGGRAPLS